jgi:MFS family permease
MLLLMVPVLFLDISPWLTTGIFLLLYAFLFACDGLIIVPCIDLFGRTIESGKRGLLLGNQQVLGGIGALMAGSVVKATLDYPLLNNDQKFSIIFGCAVVVMALSSIAMTFSRDLPRKVTLEKPNHFHYYRQMPDYVRRHPLFAQLVLTRILSIIAAMVAPFVILFCQDLLSLAPKDVSTLIVIQIIGSLLGGFVWGKVSHRLGNHRVIQFSQSLGLLLALTVILLILLPHWIMPVYLLWPLVLVNGVNMAAWIGFLSYTIDIVQPEERTVYMLISNLMTFPFAFLAFLAGIIAQSFGYAPIFVISAIAACAAVIRATRLKAPVLESETHMADASEG